jgi:hypothetical protein
MQYGVMLNAGKKLAVRIEHEDEHEHEDDFRAVCALGV